MRSQIIVLGLLCSPALLPFGAQAQTLFSDTTMADSGNWTVTASPLTTGATIDYVDNFGVSYTTALGVPQDPYSSSTTALQLKVNETSGAQSGVSASPNGLSLSGNVTLSFDMWWNYNSGGFTTGSTQMGSYGFTQSASTTQWAGIGGGQLFGAITDNGSSTSYRGYSAGSSIGATPFMGGSQSYASAYHVGLFPSVSVPAAETALDANQYGSTVAGTVGFQWIQVSLTELNGTLSESLNGNLIASYSAASIDPDIFLGMYDINNGSAGVSGAADQNYTLFDNVSVVVATPEPTTCALAIMGAAGLLAARRRTRVA